MTDTFDAQLSAALAANGSYVNGLYVLNGTGGTSSTGGSTSLGDPTFLNWLSGQDEATKQYFLGIQASESGSGSSSGSTSQTQTTPTGDPSGGAIASSVLRQYGLEELLPYVEQISRGSLTWAELQAELYDPSTAPGKVVDRLYPEIQLRRKAGFEPISIDQVQALREQYMQVFRSHDAPAGFYDQASDFRDLIVNDKSPDELNSDLNAWRLVADNAAADPSNQSILSELHRLYGITPDSGAFLSYVIDPQRGLDSIRKMVASGQLSSTSAHVGYGDLTQAEAEALAVQGVAVDQAQKGFGDLVHEQQLFGVLPGQAGAGIGRDQQLGAEFGGNAVAQQAIEQVRGQRLAEFASGGRVAAGRGSDTGLTSS